MLPLLLPRVCVRERCGSNQKDWEARLEPRRKVHITSRMWVVAGGRCNQCTLFYVFWRTQTHSVAPWQIEEPENCLAMK